MRRSVHDDTNRTQICVAFVSPRIALPKCVGPLGWVFPGSGQKRTESDFRSPFALGRRIWSARV
jgi:hypothetical protein